MQFMGIDLIYQSNGGRLVLTLLPACRREKKEGGPGQD